MSVFRTSTGVEVDLILEDGKNVFAIEIKAKRKVSQGDFRGLAYFSRFLGKRTANLLVSLDPMRQDFKEGKAVPFQDLWAELGWK